MMKSFKSFINEAAPAVSSTPRPVAKASATLQPTEDGRDNIADVSNPEILKKINAFVGSIGDGEYMLPAGAVSQLRAKLETIGLSFGDVALEGKSGSVSVDVKQYGGRWGKDGTQKPEETINDDGISHKKDGGLKLNFKYETLSNGASRVYATLV
jgi:hypothetical protein